MIETVFVTLFSELSMHATGSRQKHTECSVRYQTPGYLMLLTTSNSNSIIHFDKVYNVVYKAD